MRYFDYIDEKNMQKIFLKQPGEFTKETEINKLKYALGAFLYAPATQYNMMYKSITGQVKGVKQLAICLEDAVGINGEKEAIENLKLIFKETKDFKDKPLIFIRIRNNEQLEKIKEIIKINEKSITGIIIPKVSKELIEDCINTLNSVGLLNMYIIPIIESKEFIHNEVKEKYFKDLYSTLLKYKNRILSIRIGVTDILGIYGIRRSKDFSIYENMICYSFINDVINYLNREELDVPISGGVCELFNMSDLEIRSRYIKEIKQDKFNGLIGKTVIHPLQIPIVQALLSVTYEDYIDAVSILNSVDSKYGVSKGIMGERMNEINPHLLWAKKILVLSQIYGVLNEGVDYNELLRF